MCERDCFKYDNFILSPLNDNYIKMLFIKQLIINVLQKIEKDIKLGINNINDYDNFKKYLKIRHCDIQDKSYPIVIAL